MENLDKVYAKQVAAEYSPNKSTKMVQLKKLDNKVKQAPLIFAYTFGIIGTLIFGIGMCFALNVFKKDGTLSMIIGIIAGVIGIIMVSLNYYIFSVWMKKRKKKYAFEITELAKEILNN